MIDFLKDLCYFDENDFREARENLNYMEELHVERVLLGLEEPIRKDESKSYKKIPVPCECMQGRIVCSCVETVCPGVDWNCLYCGGRGYLTCNKCYGKGAFYISFYDDELFLCD